jgi:hypothetical protein
MEGRSKIKKKFADVEYVQYCPQSEVKDVDRIECIQVNATLSRVSFWGITITQYHIPFHPCRKVPLKKGNSQMDSSVQDNPAPAPSLSVELVSSRAVSTFTKISGCYSATSQARLKSSWTLPPWQIHSPFFYSTPICTLWYFLFTEHLWVKLGNPFI